MVEDVCKCKQKKQNETLPIGGYRKCLAVVAQTSAICYLDLIIFLIIRSYIHTFQMSVMGNNTIDRHHLLKTYLVNGYDSVMLFLLL